MGYLLVMVDGCVESWRWSRHGPSFGAGQLGYDGTSDHLKSITHARQEPIELLIAQLDLSGKELADAGLMHPADT
jgi:hypothetical protein